MGQELLGVVTVNNAKGPGPKLQPVYTDSYFNLARKIVLDHGDKQVTYAVFMRRPVTLAPKLAVDWLEMMAAKRKAEIKIELLHKEGAWVGACLLYTSPSPRDVEESRMPSSA